MTRASGRRGRDHIGVGPCSACGKVCYPTRAGARRAGKRLYPGEHVNAYACPGGSGYWHVGHLPAMVRRGVDARADITPHPRSENVK